MWQTLEIWQALQKFVAGRERNVLLQKNCKAHLSIERTCMRLRSVNWIIDVRAIKPSIKCVDCAKIKQTEAFLNQIFLFVLAVLR